ncbi:MAG: IPT/TIG domain-containing protein, partial [Acidimicrobiales bacterium]
MTKFRSRKGLASFSTSVIAASIMFSMAIGVPSSNADAPAVTPLTLVAPSGLPGVPAMPFTGTTAPAFIVPTSYVNLTVTPTSGVPGTPMTITGSGLTANTNLTLTWSTANATWVADVEPTTANYMGDSYAKFNVILTTISTDASGNFSYTTKVPTDWGGTHDIYAVANGVAVGHAGITIDRTMTV